MSLDPFLFFGVLRINSILKDLSTYVNFLFKIGCTFGDIKI